VAVVGIPFAFLFGMLADRIGAKRSVFLGLLAYTAISVIGFYMKTARDFYVLAFLVGMVQGGTQALSRSLFASLIPAHKSGEFFGSTPSSRSLPRSSARSSSRSPSPPLAAAATRSSASSSSSPWARRSSPA
jgi:MFS family permease